MKNWKTRGAWIGVILSGFAAWIISRVLDMSVSGSIKLWGWIIQVATFGSEKMRDLPYASAAMNPYPLPSTELIVIAAALFVTAIIVNAVYIAKSFFELRRRLREIGEGQTTPQLSIEEMLRDANRSFSRLTITSSVVVTCGLICAIGAMVPVSVMQQAVDVRRIYEADRDIIAPYMTPAELLKLQSDFASVETKAQFKSVMSRIADAAARGHVKIHSLD
ncbi:MAG: hypothetical protein ACLPH3_05860 [Terracidiphilus sp.]